MTIKGGTSLACAACKYQRRKCSSDCLLAPYFPADKPKMFQNAHRLFGVCNIVKILRQLDDNDKKADAMKSIIFESDMWEKFPVYGCVEYICYLHQQLQLTVEEFHYVCAQLAIYKGGGEPTNNSTMGPFFTTSDSLFDMTRNNHVANIIFDQQNSQKDIISQDYEFPFNNIMADDRQSYVETKEACDSNSESSWKETQLSQNELKNAAACFSLTSSVTL